MKLFYLVVLLIVGCQSKTKIEAEKKCQYLQYSRTCKDKEMAIWFNNRNSAHPLDNRYHDKICKDTVIAVRHGGLSGGQELELKCYHENHKLIVEQGVAICRCKGPRGEWPWPR